MGTTLDIGTDLRGTEDRTLAAVLPLSYYQEMAQRSKRSISLPAELARQIDDVAARQGTTFSAWLAATARHRLRLDAGRRAIAAWERENGPLSPAELADGLARARASLGRSEPRRSRKTA